LFLVCLAGLLYVQSGSSGPKPRAIDKIYEIYTGITGTSWAKTRAVDWAARGPGPPLNQSSTKNKNIKDFFLNNLGRLDIKPNRNIRKPKTRTEKKIKPETRRLRFWHIDC
jgi:hypothetical protein